MSATVEASRKAVVSAVRRQARRWSSTGEANATLVEVRGSARTAAN